MDTRGRALLAVAAAATFVLAAVYYGRHESGLEQPDSTEEARHVGAASGDAKDPPAARASSESQGEGARAENAEARVSSSDLDERVRSFTTPVERALAGMEDVKLKVSFEPIPEFKETLRQFAAEADDPDWSQATEARIFSEISQATGLSAVDIQADCRATMCRVLLTKPVSSPNPRYRSFNELVDSFGLKTLWIMALPDENGTPINFAYIRRGEAP